MATTSVRRRFKLLCNVSLTSAEFARQIWVGIPVSLAVEGPNVVTEACCSPGRLQAATTCQW